MRNNELNDQHSTAHALRPIVMSILTSAVSSGVTFIGIGQYQLGLITALSGCGGCLLLALTAKAVDSISHRPRRLITRTPRCSARASIRTNAVKQVRG
jgi:hypothetical protein